MKPTLILAMMIALNATVSYAQERFHRCKTERIGTTEIKTYFYPNSQTSSVHITQSGLEEGLWEHYNPDGTPILFMTYSKGLLDGIACAFDIHGRISYCTQYKQDKKHGLEQIFDEDSHLIESIPYVWGKVHGTHRQFNIYGEEIYAFEYRNGIKIRGKYLEKGRWIEVSETEIMIDRWIQSIVFFLLDTIIIPIVKFMIWLFSPFVLG